MYHVFLESTYKGKYPNFYLLDLIHIIVSILCGPKKKKKASESWVWLETGPEFWASLVAQMVKSLPAMKENGV